eukprot:PhF_6_TR25840/c0_g1_i1/m.36506
MSLSKASTKAVSPYDLNQMSWFTFTYETASGVVIFCVCDALAQYMEKRFKDPENKLEFKFDWDRNIRGTVVNLCTGGGAMYWYWWLWLDMVLPGTSIGTICIKASLDTFLYSTVQNFAFLYLYNTSRYKSHEAGMEAIRENSLMLNLMTYVTSFPSDVASFYVFGWWRELVSDLTAIVSSLLMSYWANRHVIHMVDDGVGDSKVDDPDEEGVGVGTATDATQTSPITQKDVTTNDIAKTSSATIPPPPPPHEVKALLEEFEKTLLAQKQQPQQQKYSVPDCEDWKEGFSTKGPKLRRYGVCCGWFFW